MADPLKSANSARPGSLKSPVPRAPSSPVDDLIGSFDAPEMPAGTPADPVNSLLGSFDSPEETSAGMSPGEFAPEEFAAPEGIVQDNINQFKPQNFIDRLQAGLAANDTEKVGLLKKKYGDKNVAVKDGAIYYRRTDGDKLKRLDPATFELISDLIPDFAREMVSEVAMIPGEVAGATAGAVAGMGFGAPVTATAGMLAGRVASVPLANAAADKVATMAGVPQDENRSLMAENAVGMGAEAVMPFVGSKISKLLTKRIPGTAAYKAAREAGEKEVVALSRQSEEVIAAAKALEDEGIPVNMMAQQVHNTSPQLNAKVQDVEMLPQFTAKQQEFAEGYGNALEQTLGEIARRGNPNGPVSSSRLATTVTNAVESIERNEGQAVGRFRAKALAVLGNKKQQLPAETSQNVVNIMKELGFQARSQKIVSVTKANWTKDGTRNQINRTMWVPPKDLAPIVGRLGLDEGQTRAVINSLNEYGQLISRGNEARLTDVERLIKRMGPLNEKLRGSSFGGTWGRLTGELRQHRREVIGNALGDDIEKSAFNSVMDDFSMIRNNTEQLSSVLRGDVTAKTIVGGFFRGKENLANVRALKSIVGKDSSEWGSMKEEWINQLMVKHSGNGPTGFKSEAFMNDLKKNYGDDFVREVLDDGRAGPNYDTVKNLLTVGKRIEASTRGLKVDQLTEQRKAALMEGLLGWVSNAPFRILNGAKKIIGAGGERESALMEIMNRDGYEKYIAGYKGKNRGELSKKLEALMLDYNARRAATTRTNQVLDAGKDIMKRGGKSMTRFDVQTMTPEAMTPEE